MQGNVVLDCVFVDLGIYPSYGGICGAYLPVNLKPFLTEYKGRKHLP